MATIQKVGRVFTRQYSSRLPFDPPPPDVGETANLWKKFFFFVGIPAVGLGMLNTYLHEKNDEHVRPEFRAYEYMRIRSKRYPWGDGQRTLFHNPEVNALPSGYETEH